MKRTVHLEKRVVEVPLSAFAEVIARLKPPVKQIWDKYECNPDTDIGEVPRVMDLLLRRTEDLHRRLKALERQNA